MRVLIKIENLDRWYYLQVANAIDDFKKSIPCKNMKNEKIIVKVDFGLH